MKVFVSWSGKLSRAIAQTLKQWLPCMIQSLEIFFSPEDIEKGSNWDVQISSELSQCKYGIICLTNDNISAPWINFEAGALAKELDSHISALMVNIKPSDIKGPLARYQSTKLEKTDFFQLVNNINALQEKPLDASVLQNIFNSLWEKWRKNLIVLFDKAAQPKIIRLKTTVQLKNYCNWFESKTTYYLIQKCFSHRITFGMCKSVIFPCPARSDGKTLLRPSCLQQSKI